MIYTLQGVDEESEIGKSWTPLNLKAEANMFLLLFLRLSFCKESPNLNTNTNYWQTSLHNLL